MHFYEFNIGDYAKKTQHLTNEEDLAYRRLLDLYYDTEKPVLSGGLATLSRRLRVSEESLKNVLNEFFPDGKNKHADEKIAAYHIYLLKQSENGKKGGRPKNQHVTITSENVSKPTDNPPLSQNNPVPSQPLTTKPLNQLKALVPSDDGRLPCPHEKIIETYHRILPTMPSVRVWTEQRKKKLASRWREDESRQSLDYWERFFNYISKSDFLCGRTEKPFSCDLEWIVNSANFVKIIEGRYHPN